MTIMFIHTIRDYLRFMFFSVMIVCVHLTVLALAISFQVNFEWDTWLRIFNGHFSWIHVHWFKVVSKTKRLRVKDKQSWHLSIVILLIREEVWDSSPRKFVCDTKYIQNCLGAPTGLFWWECRKIAAMAEDC